MNRYAAKTMWRTIRLRWIVLAVFMIYIWLTMQVPGMGEWYARILYPVLSTPLARISSLVPFSLGDCFIYGSITGLLIYIIYRLVKRRQFKRTLFFTVEYLAWVYVWFYLAWGLTYFRDGFYQRSGIAYVAYEPEQFRHFLNLYTDSLNASFCDFTEPLPKELVDREVKKGYEALAGRFDLMQPRAYQTGKPMLIPSLMSGVGVLGYIGSFFNEFHLNPALLPVQYPATYAHEMAHVLGVSSEAESNLYSFLVCSRSETPQIRFAAWFSLFTYVLGNAYTLLDAESFDEWRSRIRPEVKELFNAKNAYWQNKYNPLIGEAQDIMYNQFLKSNNIPSGRKNYSEVVGLLISWLENEQL
ncbi:MAG: DUF3810 domain-containing protein [Tannerellaceae bacterium]|nr:DUF3810 domain-containing protein [Tannerellaceae bacterium]MCD8262929.1 DUF3810 domain-containing protein [Tannerellaceae bacterium]